MILGAGRDLTIGPRFIILKTGGLLDDRRGRILTELRLIFARTYAIIIPYTNYQAKDIRSGVTCCLRGDFER